MESSVRRGHEWMEKGIAGTKLSPAIILTIAFWIVIIILVIYAFRTEHQHKTCYTDRQKECISPYYRILPEEGDDLNTLLQRTENGIRIAEEGNSWRKTFLGSVLLSFVIGLIYKKWIPNPIEFTIAFFIIYVILYSANNWYDMHLYYRIREQQLRTVNQLRVNLGLMNESQACGVYGSSDTQGFNGRRCANTNTTTAAN
jgi:hypothetical protein